MRRSVLLTGQMLALALVLPIMSHAQPRTFAAQHFMLDNGIGNNITIQTPTGPFSSYTWTLPSTAPPGSTAMTPVGTAVGQTLYWDGSNWVASSGLFNDGTNVGIGTTTPSYGFVRKSTLNTPFGSVGSLFDATIAPSSGTTGYDYSLASEAHFTSSTSISSGIIGAIGFGMLENTASTALSKAIGAAGAADQNNSSQLLTEAAGLHGEVANMSSSGITTASAVEAYIYNTSGGSITTARDLYLTAPYNTGAITKFFGIYQENLTAESQWPYWYSDGSGGALVQVTSTGELGIGLGSTAPGYKLDVKNSFADVSGFGASSNFDVVANPTSASTERFVAISALAESDNSAAISSPGYVEGIRSESQLNSTATADLGQAIGAAGLSSNYNATGTVTSGAGLHGEVRNFSTGTISTASALEAAIFNVGGGTITSAKILHVQNPNNSLGTIANAYGLYIDDLTAATLNYPIYVSDGSTNARFSVRNDGKVGIGTDNPAATLDVEGSTRIGTNANVGAVTGIYNYGGTLNFPSTAAQSSSDMTVIMSGSDIVEGDAVIVRPMNAVIMPNSSYTAWVSGNAQVTVRFNNYSSVAQDPPSGIFKFTLIQH